MSSTPHSGKMGAPGPGHRAAPAAAAASTAPTPAAAKQAKTRNMLIAAGAGVVVLAGLIALLVWAPWQPEPPRLDSEPYVIARFAATDDFEDLPFERQYTYMELLDDKEDALEQAYADKQLNDVEYRRALQAAYFGKWLSRTKKYFDYPPGQARQAYLDKLVQKKLKKDARQDAEEEEEDIDEDLRALRPDEIKRDDSRQEEQIAAWPTDMQAQWMEFRTAYKARKDYWKQREQPEPEKATAGTTGGSK